MARTKAENFDEVRESILDAAARLFAGKGFRNTNIIDIGEACNASKSRMYHYFPSKDAILEEMLRGHVVDLVEQAGRVAKAAEPPEKRLRDYILLHLKYYTDRRDRHAVLIEDAAYLGPEAQQQLKRAQQTLMGHLADLLQELNPHKYAQRHTASAAAMLIYGAMNWTYTWYKPSGKLSLESLAAETADLCLNGVKPASGRR